MAPRRPRNNNNITDLSSEYDSHDDDGVLGVASARDHIEQRGQDHGELRHHREEQDYLDAPYQPLSFKDFPIVPKNAGMAQRWVRVNTRIGGESDRDNMYKRRIQGWKPQPVKDLAVEYPELVNGTGENAGCIVFKEHVLMERPIQLNKRSRRAQQELTHQKANAEPEAFRRAKEASGRGAHGLRVDEFSMQRTHGGSGDDL